MKTIIGVKFKGVCINISIIKSLQQANGTVLLDQRFRAMPFYLILTIFKEYNELKQWNENKYWATCHQLIAVVILLLIKDDLAIF